VVLSIKKRGLSARTLESIDPRKGENSLVKEAFRKEKFLGTKHNILPGPWALTLPGWKGRQLESYSHLGARKADEGKSMEHSRGLKA